MPRSRLISFYPYETGCLDSAPTGIKKARKHFWGLHAFFVSVKGG